MDVQKDLTTPGFQGQVGSSGDSSSLMGKRKLWSESSDLANLFLNPSKIEENWLLAERRPERDDHRSQSKEARLCLSAPALDFQA